MDWALFRNWFPIILAFWSFVGFAVEIRARKDRDQWFKKMERATKESYSSGLSSLHSEVLKWFEEFYVENDNPPTGNFTNRLNSFLWLFILISTILALSCAIGYGWMEIPGGLEYILSFILVGAFVGTVIIAWYVGRVNTRPHELPSSKRKIMHILLWIAVAIVIALIPVLFFDWTYVEGVESMPGAPMDFVKQTVLKVNPKGFPDSTITINFIIIGIVVGLVCAIFTGLSIGGVEGGWSGVAAGLWGGFISVLVASLPYIELDSYSARKLVQVVIAAGIGVGVIAFIAKSVSLFRDKLSSWQLKLFSSLRRYRAHATLLTSLLSMLFLTFCVYHLRRDIYYEFRDKIISASVVFLALNVIADSFSIIETHWILRKLGKQKGPMGIISLVATDLVFSGAIYLALPLATRSYNVLPAILFRGPDPWLGILFWSTFSTSIMFYLFVLGAFVFPIIKPIRHMVLYLAKILYCPARAIIVVSCAVCITILLLLSATT